MSIGRRKVRLEQGSSFIFNRMASAYEARPPYPVELIEAIVTLSREAGGHVVDLGAGIGHLALPLAERGVAVVAIDPARSMLEKLEASARAKNLDLRSLHALAEALPLEPGSVDLALIADALHFMDKELVAAELSRVLRAGGGLAVVTSEFADTAFMRAVRLVMDESAPRRPRSVHDAIVQLFTLLGVRERPTLHFHDETPVERHELESILRSISFIGPAMNAERFEAFRARIHALSEVPIWARRFTLHAGLGARPRG